MRILIQRVSGASVTIDHKINGAIGRGFLLLVGICHEDTHEDIEWLVQKVVNMRIFGDEDGKMNRSIRDIGGELLVVSQFTLHASTKKGNRPGFTQAAKQEQAIPLYEAFLSQLQSSDLKVATGIFGADMQVELINDGPVTIWLDSKNRE